MNAVEIRERQAKIDKDIDAREEVECPDNIHRQETAMMGVCYWLAELAGQVAERLAKIANPLMVVDTESKSLRDEFAMAVLMAIISQGTMNSDMDVVPYVQDAYTIADAMLAARKK